MVHINLRDYYPWYTQDEFIEVPEVIAAELEAGRRYEPAHRRRMRRNKVSSLEDILTEPICLLFQPEIAFECMEQYCSLCQALNSLSRTQGQRVQARYLQSKKVCDIAKSDGVSESAITQSIQRGLETMKTILKKGVNIRW